MTKNLKLSLAIASSLGLFAQPALATTDIDFHSGGAKAQITFASELPVTTRTLAFGTAAAFTIRIPIPTYTIDSSNPFFIKLAIVGGAQFKTMPTISCAVDSITTADGLNATDTAIKMTKVVGAAGATTLTYQLNTAKVEGLGTTPYAQKDTIKLQLTDTVAPGAPGVSVGKGCLVVGLLDVTATSGLVNQSISARVEYKDGSTSLNTTYQADLITFKPAAQSNYNAGGSVVVIDVAKSSRLFTTGVVGVAGVTKVGENTAYLGTVSYTASTNAALGTDGLALAPGTIISDATLTISGPALGAVAVPTVTGEVNTGAIYLVKSNNGLCTNANAIASAQVTAANVSFSLTTTQITAGVDVCLRLDGEHPVDKGQITAVLTATAAGSHRPVLSANNNNLVNVGKNGQSLKVLNIPGPSSQDKPFIRISNMGNQTGKVFGSLYNQDDGAPIGTANVEITSLAPFAVDVLDSTELAVLFGVEGWPKRAWMQVDAELSDIAIQGLIRTPAGVLSNLSSGSIKK